jgi:hypothetical protein
LPDNAIEPDEAFNVTLSNPSNGLLGAVATAVFTIIDDDSPIDFSSIVYLPIISRSGPPGPDLVVDSINVANGSVEVTIKNVGNVAINSAFWVDLFVNPTVVPTKVNDTIETLAQPGFVWGTSPSLLPLAPGASFTLTINDASFAPQYSTFSGTIAAGDRLIAHVDSANISTTYGAVNESHEIASGAYNNIREISAPAAAFVPDVSVGLDWNSGFLFGRP